MEDKRGRLPEVTGEERKTREMTGASREDQGVGGTAKSLFLSPPPKTSLFPGLKALLLYLMGMSTACTILCTLRLLSPVMPLMPMGGLRLSWEGWWVAGSVRW